MLKQRMKEGDRYHVFRGLQMRRIGKNESHVRLLETTLNATWREFRNLEKRFVVSRGDGDAEGTDANGDSETDDDGGWEDEKRRHRSGKAFNGKKNRANEEVRNARRMRRRGSHIRSRMGMWEAGLSIDNYTYYNTDLAHRLLWWWKQDDVRGLIERVQRLVIRRINWDLYETDELVQRGLCILGRMSGEDILVDRGPPRTPYDGSGGAGVRRRRRSYKASHSNRTPSRSRNGSRAGVRDLYEKEIRRTTRPSPSLSPSSRSLPTAPSPTARVGGSYVSMSRRGERVNRSQAPSVREYEIVNPGRIWVDVQESPRNAGRDSNGERNVNRPPPAHFESYVRERPHSRGRTG